MNQAAFNLFNEDTKVVRPLPAVQFLANLDPGFSMSSNLKLFGVSATDELNVDFQDQRIVNAFMIASLKHLLNEANRLSDLVSRIPPKLLMEVSNEDQKTFTQAEELYKEISSESRDTTQHKTEPKQIPIDEIRNVVEPPSTPVQQKKIIEVESTTMFNGEVSNVTAIAPLTTSMPTPVGS